MRLETNPRKRAIILARMTSDPACPFSLERLCAINASPLVTLVVFALLLPVWGATRVAAWKTSLDEKEGLDSSEIFLGAAAAPLDRIPWYYDRNAQQRFLNREIPLALVG
jgi:hypothetical protein